MRLLIPLVISLAAAAGCAKSGMGATVRTDVTARMETSRPTIEACYEAALLKNRKLRGTMVVVFEAAPSTGEFTGVQVVQDGVGDQALATCVIGAVGKLKLAQPQTTKVAIEYPIDFAPTK